MSTTLSRILTGLIVLVFWAVSFPEPAKADITVEGHFLKRSKPAGPKWFIQHFEIQVNVDGPAVENAVVYVTCDNPSTKVLDRKVKLGDVEGNTVFRSQDTFKIRQDSGIPFDADCLVYDIAYESTIVLSGVVTDKPLAFANVKVKVDYRNAGRPIIEEFEDPDAGRPIIETFDTVADADGNYEVEVSVGAQDGFVTVTGEGTGELEDADLTSNLGSVGGLHTDGTSGSIIVGGEDVTHITTALAVLAESAFGGEITNDEDLQTAESLVSGADLLNLASAIKTVIDNPDIEIPGDGDLLGFLSDPAAVEAFVTETMEENPEEFAEAFAATVEELPLQYVESELEGTTLYTILANESPLFIAGSRFTFDVGGIGNVTVPGGSSTMAWSVDADGDVVIVPDDLSQTFFPFCPIPGQQLEATSITEEIKLQRIVEGVASDQVFQLTRTRIVFAPECMLPDEIFQQEPFASDVFLAVNDSQIIPVDPAVLVGGSRIATYGHVDNGSVGLNNTRLGADFLNFTTATTGSTQRRGFAFNWSVDAEGRLNITFSNGDTNQFIVVADDGGPIVRTVVISDLTDGTVVANGFAFIEPDDLSQFTEADLSDQHYRNLNSVNSGGLFDFLFENGGTGCRVFSTVAQALTWESTVDNRMELIRRAPFDPEFIIAKRSWEGGVTVTGSLGDRYWLIENLDFLPDPPSDPTVTPGRINSYERLPGLAGNTLPVAVNDFVATGIDTSIDIDAVANDTDVDGDTLFIGGADGVSDEGGTIELLFNPDFTVITRLRYTPPALFVGGDRFSYVMRDVRDCGAAIEGEVFITVNP